MGKFHDIGKVTLMPIPPFNASGVPPLSFGDNLRNPGHVHEANSQALSGKPLTLSGNPTVLSGNPGLLLVMENPRRQPFVVSF
jgi:hypothetical protein